MLTAHCSTICSIVGTPRTTDLGLEDREVGKAEEQGKDEDELSHFYLPPQAIAWLAVITA